MTTQPQPESQSSATAESPAGAQSISISVGNNSGAVQAVNAGGNAVVSQAVGSAEAVAELNPAEVADLFDEILALIEAADLPESEKKKIRMRVELAKDEAAEKEPNKPGIVGDLEQATGLLKRLSGTAEAGKKLVELLKGPVAKLAGWLGLAAVHFLG